MEPADQRRDDLTITRKIEPMYTPQWSPPTSGGTTNRWEKIPEDSWLPQWSPPTSGGTTESAGPGR